MPHLVTRRSAAALSIPLGRELIIGGSSGWRPTCGKSVPRRSQKRPRPAEILGSFKPPYGILYDQLKPWLRLEREPVPTLFTLGPAVSSREAKPPAPKRSSRSGDPSVMGDGTSYHSGKQKEQRAVTPRRAGQ